LAFTLSVVVAVVVVFVAIVFLLLVPCSYCCSSLVVRAADVDSRREAAHGQIWQCWLLRTRGTSIHVLPNLALCRRFACYQHLALGPLELVVPSRLRVFVVKVFGQSAPTCGQLRGAECSRRFPKKKNSPLVARRDRSPLLLETRPFQNLDRLGHRRGVQKPTQIPLIAQISQSDSVIVSTPQGATTADSHLRVPSRRCEGLNWRRNVRGYVA
jgi:hypothetical protein